MTNVKKVDCALLPPCAKTVHNGPTTLASCGGNADSSHPGHGLDPLNYGWMESNGYNAPEWFFGSAVPDDLFEGEREDESVEDLQGDQSDVVTEFDDADESSSDWSDDSESETEI